MLYVWPSYCQEPYTEHEILPAFKILDLPKTWSDKTPVYKEPKLLFYTQEFTYKCSKCHVKDLTSKPKKSHLPFGAHKDMLFTHGLNLRCMNCHNPEHPDAFTDYDGSVIARDKPVFLCRNCHGVIYRDWRAGVHGRINGYWNNKLGPQKKIECNQCHNPHHPKFPDLKPMPPPVNPVAHKYEKDKHHE